MTAAGYSAAFKVNIVQQAIRSGTRPEALALLHQVPLELVEDWLQQAANALPALFAEAATDALVKSGWPTRPGGEPPTRMGDRTFRTLFETSRDAIMLLTDAGFSDCNPSTLTIFGLESMDDFVCLHPSDLSPPVQPGGRQSFEMANEYIAQAMEAGHCHFEWMHRRKNGEVFEADVLLSCFTEAGRLLLQATVRDISHVKRLQYALTASHAELVRAHAAVERQNNELALLCMTDQLTGLFNRRKLDEVIQVECKVAQRYRRPVAVILADLDHFKRINDTFGHQSGDAVLREAARVMQRNVRETDVLGRWGGEEFMVVCRNTGAVNARQLADRMRLAMQMHSFDGIGHNTCSFGVAAFDSSQDVYTMIREADGALYDAKAAGRNRVIVSKSRAGVAPLPVAHGS